VQQQFKGVAFFVSSMVLRYFRNLQVLTCIGKTLATGRDLRGSCFVLVTKKLARILSREIGLPDMFHELPKIPGNIGLVFCSLILFS
jgi:hypothetical protein